MDGPRRGSRLRELGPLLLLTLAFHVPFVNQPFHLDDVQYLDIARNVLLHPLFPLDLPYVFEGRNVSLWGHTHPPLNSYFLAGLLLLSANPPSAAFLHLVYLCFPLLATLSFYYLARRFVAAPFLATVIFISVPTLVVPAHTLMADVPLLALWLSACLLFICGVDGGELRCMVLASVALAAALFFAYQGLALVPLLAFYAWQRRKLGRRVAAVLSSPVLLMAAWQFLGYVHKGAPYAATLFGYLEPMGFLVGAKQTTNAISALSFLGGVVIFSPFALFLCGRRWRGVPALLGLVLGAWIASRRLAGYTLPQKGFFVFCFTGGFVLVSTVLLGMSNPGRREQKDSDLAFLSLWFLGVIACTILLFTSGSARYILPGVPPLILLLVRAAPNALKSRYSRGVFFVTLVICQVMLSLALSQADYEFATIGRQEACDLKHSYLRVGQPFLFSGEWGLRYYLSQFGGQIMTPNSTGQPGELVVKTRLFLSKNFDNPLERSLVLVDRRKYFVRSPVRLLDYRAKAGFWSDGWGVLPFWFSTHALDEVMVYRIGPRDGRAGLSNPTGAL